MATPEKVSLTLEFAAAFLAGQAAPSRGLSKVISQDIHQRDLPKHYGGESSPWPSSKTTTPSTSLPVGGAVVQRGQCWRYQLRSVPAGPMVIVSAQYSIDGTAV
jgi:hypothetical protein